jgi:hypothetical protein
VNPKPTELVKDQYCRALGHITGFPRLGFTHLESPPLVLFVVVKSPDRCLSLGVGVHLDKAEPLAAPDTTILDDLGALHGTERCEPLLQIGRRYRVSQITNIQF